LESDQLTEHSGSLFYDYCRLPLLSFYAPKSVQSSVYPLRHSRPRVIAPAIAPALERANTARLILRNRYENAEPLAKRILKEPALAKFKIDGWQSFGPRLQAVQLRRAE
jgi:hypothetical protein